MLLMESSHRTQMINELEQQHNLRRIRHLWIHCHFRSVLAVLAAWSVRHLTTSNFKPNRDIFSNLG
jgi:hypothetical protein